MEQLEPGIESQTGRDDGQVEIAIEGIIQTGTNLDLEAKHAAGDFGAPSREAVEVALELPDIALEPRCQREMPGHILRKEGGHSGSRAVNRCRTPGDYGFQARCLFTGGK